jgi:succinyl-CoA synthetase beta subunit
MSKQITELIFLEKLAPRFQVPVPEYLTADASSGQIRAALARWGNRGIVKPDILTGKRGKAGVVKQVHDYVEAQKQLKYLHGFEVNGHLPRTSYMVEYIESDLEIYTAITYDSRYLGPSMTVSLAGGMDIEDVDETQKVTFAVDVYKGVGAYQVSQNLEKLACPKKILGTLSQVLVNLWDMFISTGMRMCEVNPWRVNKHGKPIACDFKAVFDEANFKFQNLGFDIPEYPANITIFEEEMNAWSASSHQGQAHVAKLGGNLILPILFGGGASTIITETLMQNGGEPMFLSDFGGNPPYERMFGTAKICFKHYLGKARLLLILGGKANNTMIDITFSAIADAIVDYVEENGPIDIPVVIGRGGPQLIKGLLTMKDTLESLGLSYVIFGPDTPVTLVAEYAAKLAKAYHEKKELENAS